MPPVTLKMVMPTNRHKINAGIGGAQGLSGGAEGNRTPDLLDANEARYQLRYSPWWDGGSVAGTYSPAARR